MIERFAQLPESLASNARTAHLPGVPGREPIPALLIHPNWIDPCPTVLWMHGRTAYKEIDSGRFLRWMRRGIAAVSIDLPGHGSRRDTRADTPSHTLDVMTAVLPEIDRVVEALADPIWQGVFDLDRLGIGGMSLGGMATLRRLCDPHEFRAAAVECTSGDLLALYHPISGSKPWGLVYPPDRITPLDPVANLSGFRPLPVLALHSESDAIVPWSAQSGFLNRLRQHFAAQGADPELVQSKTWSATGAPDEHSGFGRVSNEAKTIQTEFFVRTFRPTS